MSAAACSYAAAGAAVAALAAFSAVAAVAVVACRRGPRSSRGRGLVQLCHHAAVVLDRGRGSPAVRRGLRPRRWSTRLPAGC